MKRFAKIKRDEFANAVGEDLLTINEFSEKIGIHPSYLSRLSSDTKTGCRCGKKTVRRILSGFNGRYEFDDLFFWA